MTRWKFDRDLARQASAMRDKPVTVKRARLARDANGNLRPVGEPEVVEIRPAIRYREMRRIVGRHRNSIPPQ
jgi:hypothetical protein